jgi:uncharacterized membrane protein
MVTQLGTFPFFINRERKFVELFSSITCTAEFVFRLKINEPKKL